jgi:hypothetical protein
LFILVSLDLTFHILSPFVSAPQIHCSHLLYALHYLYGTSTHCLFFSRSSYLHLQTYYNASWTGDPSDRRSLTASHTGDGIHKHPLSPTIAMPDTELKRTLPHRSDKVQIAT